MDKKKIYMFNELNYISRKKKVAEHLRCNDCEHEFLAPLDTKVCPFCGSDMIFFVDARVEKVDVEQFRKEHDVEDIDVMKVNDIEMEDLTIRLGDYPKLCRAKALELFHQKAFETFEEAFYFASTLDIYLTLAYEQDGGMFAYEGEAIEAMTLKSPYSDKVIEF